MIKDMLILDLCESNVISITTIIIRTIQEIIKSEPPT